MQSNLLHEELGEFLFSTYGNDCAILARGDDGFRSRFRNLFDNHKSDRCKAHVMPLDEITSYVMVTKEAFRDIVQRHYWCTAAEGEDPDVVSAQRAEAFMATRVKDENLLRTTSIQTLGEFAVSYCREESD